MNERYSEEVKSILEAAQQQAVINYNQELTCAHLLVALAGSEGFFPFLLKNAGADAGTFTAEAKRLVKKIPSVKGQDRGLMMSTGAARVLAIAAQNAGQGEVNICHLVGALASDGDSDVTALLKKYGIMTLVDSVSAMFGAEFKVDEWQIDIACGGSQKAMSAPSGLTFVSISDDAFSAMRSRKTPIASFYCNLLTFENYYKDKWFPYTMPASDIYGLREAVGIIEKDKDRLVRHARISKAVRETLTAAGLMLYAESGYSPTVTVFNVPDNIKTADIIETMKNDYGILIAGSFDYLAGKVLRIGHMGNSANTEDVALTLDALDKTLRRFNFEPACSLRDSFMHKMQQQ